MCVCIHVYIYIYTHNIYVPVCFFYSGEEVQHLSSFQEVTLGGIIFFHPLLLSQLYGHSTYLHESQ